MDVDKLNTSYLVQSIEMQFIMFPIIRKGREGKKKEIAQCGFFGKRAGYNGYNRINHTESNGLRLSTTLLFSISFFLPPLRHARANVSLILFHFFKGVNIENSSSLFPHLDESTGTMLGILIETGTKKKYCKNRIRVQYYMDNGSENQ